MSVLIDDLITPSRTEYENDADEIGSDDYLGDENDVIDDDLEGSDDDGYGFEDEEGNL